MKNTIQPESLIGKTIVCAETGKSFVGESVNGFTTNYARDSEGNVYSDEGVYIRAKKELIDENKVYAYVSCDGKFIQGWKQDHKLMTVIAKWENNSGFAGKMVYFDARDENGQKWHGKAKQFGHCITMRKVKN